MGQIIDCDAGPTALDNCSVVSHYRHGKLEWDKSKISLNRLHGLFKEDEQTDLAKVREAVMRTSAVNANVLDYLTAHRECIPESWSSLFPICFLGTMFQADPDSRFSDTGLFPGVGYLRAFGWSSGGLSSGVVSLDIVLKNAHHTVHFDI